MPLHRGSARLGWVGKGHRYFLRGRHCHGPGEAGHPVTLVTTSPGAAQLADCVGTRGTWEGWLGLHPIIHDLPVPWLAIYTAVAPPLLRLLGAPNFAIDLTGKSSKGKTTSLKIGVSAQAEPWKGRGYFGWSGSVAGTEGAAGMLCDHVLALDEGQLVPPHEWPKAGAMLHALIDGAGRNRGALGRLGMAYTDSWRTAILSTSEDGITGWAPHDGIRARVLEIRDQPFPDADSAEAAEKVIYYHYGHLTQRMVEFLVARDKAQIERLRRRWDTILAELAADAAADLSRRAARYVATLILAADLVHGPLAVPAPTVDMRAWIWSRVKRVCGEDDKAERALRVAWNLYESRSDDFYDGMDHVEGEGGKMFPKRQPSGGWLGYHQPGWKHVAFFRDRLDLVLKSAGFGDTSAVYRTWAERGITRTNARDVTLQVRRPNSGRAGPLSTCIAILFPSEDGAGVDAGSESA